jgi:hypothetical protein
MPISKKDRAHYPADWKEVSSSIRFGRAKGRCEWCGKPHLEQVLVLPGGRWASAELLTFENRCRWESLSTSVRVALLSCLGFQWHDSQGRKIRLWPEEIEAEAPDIRLIRVVLTCAHLNHTPEDCRQENLAALCQRCHLAYDAENRAARRRRRALEQGGRQTSIEEMKEQ